MRWDDVQERFPNDWIVLEATKAYSKEGECYIEEMSLIDSYEESTKVLKQTMSCTRKTLTESIVSFTPPVLRLWHENDMPKSEVPDEYNRNLWVPV